VRPRISRRASQDRARIVFDCRTANDSAICRKDRSSRSKLKLLTKCAALPKIIFPKSLLGGMKRLASKIESQLQVGGVGHYAAYEDELQRIWPLNEKDREAKIAQFAMRYGFRLAFYKEGLCAIFQKTTTPKLGR
jgi:hypothetical protein